MGVDSHLIHGSWVYIYIFLQDAIQIDEDLTANSERSLETLVSVGMTLGVSKRKMAPQDISRLAQCRLED